MVRAVWTIALFACLGLPPATGVGASRDLPPRTADADAWVDTLQTNSPEKHLDFVTRFPESPFAGRALQRLYWLLEQQSKAAGPEVQFPMPPPALRPLRKEFLPRLVRVLPDLPRWGKKGETPLVDHVDPYHWMEQIDRRWWVYGLPAKEREKLQQELAEGYLQQLDSDEEDRRCRACGELGYLGFADARGRLRMIAETDQECDEAAILAIGRLQDSHDAGFLLAQLDKSTLAAISALGWLRSRQAVPRISTFTRAKDAPIREIACESLGLIGDPRGVVALEERASDQNEVVFVRRAAIEALGRIADVRAVPTLASIMKETGNDFYAESVEAMGRIGSKEAVELLSGEITEKGNIRRWTPSRALAHCEHPQSALALVETLYEARMGPDDFGPHVDEPRDAVFDGAEEEYRRYCCGEAVAVVWSFQPTDRLLAVLESESDALRGCAAYALGAAAIPDPRAVEALIPLLDDKAVGASAAFALGRLRDSRALEPLIAALGHEDVVVRRFSAHGLADLGDERAVAPLVRLLEDPDASLAAVLALRQMKAKEPSRDTDGEDRQFHGPFDAMSDDEVKQMLVDPDRATYVGERAFGELIRRRLLPKSADEAIRYFILIGARDDLVALWPRTKRVLQADLHSQSPQRQFYAARCLIRIGYGEDTVAELTDALIRSDNEQMALECFNCGKQQLREAAKNWSSKKGLVLETRPLGRMMAWGAMKEE